MRRREDSQSGFGVVEIVIIIVVIALLGGIAWYTLGKQKSDTVQNNNTNNSSNNSNSNNSNNNQQNNNQNQTSDASFSIKELGISIILPKSGLDGLTYTVENPTAVSPAAYFTTSAMHTACEQLTAAVGVIQKTSKDPATTTPKLSSDSYVKVGDYYYTYQHTQQPCDTTDTVHQQQNIQSDLLKEALATAKHIQ